MMNFMQALIFSVPQFYKLFRNYPFPGVLPTAHNPPPSNPTVTLFTPRSNTDAEL
ncbi:hypothetical protein PSFL_23610 [Pseudomonas sp. DD1]